jgi:glycine/D-amino acid oxidase-like deaminating enzyme
LYLVDNDGEASAKYGLKTQQNLGCPVEWLEPQQIKQFHPLVDVTRCVGATFGRQDGTMSPLDVLLGYRHKAIELGACFMTAQVSQLRQQNSQITGVQLSNGDVYEAPVVINAAGAWASSLATTIGVDLPVQPVKKQVYAVEIETSFEDILPMLLLPNGQYLFHEGDHIFTTGGTLPDDPITESDFGWSRERFEERLWEGLVGFMPAFDRLKIINGWAGLYAVNSFDHNAILGEYPTMRGFYLCNGFSGHGFQQCHAVGRYIAELILGSNVTLDLSIFSPQRLLDNKPVFENPSRII